MKILLISNYPHDLDKSQSVFVYRLMESLIQQGCEIVVISPQNWRTKIKKIKELPGDKLYGKENAIVYRPRYFDLPNRIRIGNYTLGRYNSIIYKKTVKKIIKELEFKPDIVYAHFLYRPGPAAIWAANYFKVPSIVALGESTLSKHIHIYGKKNMKDLVQKFTGIISVSELNKKYCIDELGIEEQKIKVFPNAVNTDVFYPRDKSKMRKKYNLPLDKFIVVFTGHFIERKGPLRVLEALNKCNDKIYGVFIGSGEQEPYGNKVLFKGRLTHEQVPEMLSAADVFVLPTLNEGSCNAIVEAMACSLPIISSDIAAIKEQVNEDVGILVNPNNIFGLKEAISDLYTNIDKRNFLAKNAILKANSLKASNRASDIKNYIEKIIKIH